MHEAVKEIVIQIIGAERNSIMGLVVRFEKGYQKRNQIPLSIAVLQTEMAREIVGDEVGLAPLHCGAYGAHDLYAGVRVVGAHVLG